MTSTLAHSSQLLLPGLDIRTARGKGRGVFALYQISPETLVVVGKFVKLFPDRTSHSFQMGWNRHVKLDKVAEIINHSCDPNLRICNNSLGGYNFHAIRTIEAGEELTWDYAMSESQSIAVEKCLCGVPQCRGKSVGFTDLPLEEQQILHSKGVARYLSEWYIQQLTQTILRQS